MELFVSIPLQRMLWVTDQWASPRSVMAQSISTRTPAIHLGRNGRDGQVLVYGEGNEKFLLTVQEAIKACGAYSTIAQFQTQMQELTELLSKWTTDRKRLVRDAYLSVKGGGLFFLVVMAGKEFDPDLEDELTALDIEIANSAEFDLLRLDVQAIPDSPPDCVDSFLTAN